MAGRRNPPDRRRGGHHWWLPLVVVLLGVIAVAAAVMILTGRGPALDRPDVEIAVPELVPPNTPDLPRGPVVPPVDPRVGAAGSPVA